MEAVGPELAGWFREAQAEEPPLRASREVRTETKQLWLLRERE